MSLEPITSIAAEPASSAAASASPAAASTAAATSADTALPFAVVNTNVTPIMPPGYTQTQTTKADGVVTTVITNATGGMVDTIFSTSTVDTSGTAVSVWA